ncbi:hypothetical protein CDIK_3703 [Cucumispora dikerogammari]|nr:hypothetical protein CDIK_3703 [Cucumispora dikerogammari]
MFSMSLYLLIIDTTSNPTINILMFLISVVSQTFRQITFLRCVEANGMDYKESNEKKQFDKYLDGMYSTLSDSLEYISKDCFSTQNDMFSEERNMFPLSNESFSDNDELLIVLPISLTRGKSYLPH